MTVRIAKRCKERDSLVPLTCFMTVSFLLSSFDRFEGPALAVRAFPEFFSRLGPLAITAAWAARLNGS